MDYFLAPAQIGGAYYLAPDEPPAAQVVGIDFPIAYDVRNFVTADFPVAYEVRNFVAADFGISFSVRQLVTADFPLAYAVEDSGLPPEEPITLARAKRHLRVVLSDEDQDIQGMITAAREMLEKRVNRALTPRTVEERAFRFTEGMPLSFVPYLDGLAVGYTDPDGNAQTLSNSALYLDTSVTPPRMYSAFGETWPATQPSRDAVTLSYRAGYDGNTPAPLIQWMLLAIGTMYDHRATEVVGTITSTISEDFMKWLWQPYKVYT
jgi:uncharacterized phiE125 gp8 family phage protein